MADPIRGMALPHAQSYPSYSVWGVPKGETWHLGILDEQILGLYCHWWRHPEEDRARHHLCLIPDECPCEQHAMPTQWIGFCAAVLMPEKVRFVLRWPPGSAKNLLALVGRNLYLRGRWLEVTHHADRPLEGWEIKQSGKYTGSVPSSFPIEPTLRTLFRVPRLPTEIVLPADIPTGEGGPK